MHPAGLRRRTDIFTALKLSPRKLARRFAKSGVASPRQSYEPICHRTSPFAFAPSAYFLLVACEPDAAVTGGQTLSKFRCRSKWNRPESARVLARSTKKLQTTASFEATESAACLRLASRNLYSGTCVNSLRGVGRTPRSSGVPSVQATRPGQVDNNRYILECVRAWRSDCRRRNA